MTGNDRLYWVLTPDERGPAFGPVTDEAAAIRRAEGIGGGAFVLGVAVTFAAYPNWPDDSDADAWPARTGHEHGADMEGVEPFEDQAGAP